MLTVLGSTGSIGRQTLDVVRHLSGLGRGFEIAALTANRDVTALEAQCREFKPGFAAMFDAAAASELKTRLADTSVKVLSGEAGVEECADTGDTVLSAISGFAGLKPALTAIRRGNRLALANKETLVGAGKLVMDAVAKFGATLLPVDSEHSAIFQCLAAYSGAQHTERSTQGTERRTGDERVRRIVLTASGGAFRGFSRERLEQMSVEDALRHPTWLMGAKITVDSSTLMNKGLELIEAMWLFDVSPEKIEVVVHPQSVLHSAVEFADGAVIGQMGTPDMRLPIQFALTYPKRTVSLAAPLDFTAMTLTFEPPDTEVFSCLRMARECAERAWAARFDTDGGDSSCLVMNGANEAAVSAVLQKKRKFGDIPHIIESALEKFSGAKASGVEDILALNEEVNAYVRSEKE
jgi:1-deoxy-D-xylulose-5-phosphate reductoisomerase